MAHELWRLLGIPDPAEGVPKLLDITYFHDGQGRGKSFSDGQPVELP